MSPKIKDTKRRNSLVSQPIAVSIPYIAFSFRYLTNNKNHGIEYFQHNVRDGHAMHAALIDRLRDLCLMNMADAGQIGKIAGYEKIPFKNLSQAMQRICKNTGIVSNDSSLIVFRFCGQSYRILCKADRQHSNLLYIIAFDFNYSAYNHGG